MASSPTTPVRPIAESAFSTPSTAEHGTSPQELTPRSKVRAMVAAIDDESDTELPPKEKIRAPLAPSTGNIQKVVAPEPSWLKGSPSREGDKEQEDDEEGEDDEEALLMPRGRLAARLRERAAAKQVSSSDQESVSDQDAYARIKKRLISREAKSSEKSPPADDGYITSLPATSTINGIRRDSASENEVGHLDSPSTSPDKHRTSSGDLFVTSGSVPKSRNPSDHLMRSDGSDSDLSPDPPGNQRLLDLAAREKAKLEAKEAAKDKKRREEIIKRREFDMELSRDASAGVGLSDEDGFADRKLTQQSRPTRKASKKALEEMNRETQRMSRNMQLAHQAKTKKKITKDSLFARFNFRTSALPTVEPLRNPSSSTAASSVPGSEREDQMDKHSPPTSPLEPDDSIITPLDKGCEKDLDLLDARTNAIEPEELPSIVEVMTQPNPTPDKGKGKAVDHNDSGYLADVQRKKKKTVFSQPLIKIRPQKPISRFKDIDFDSDSDLEVLRTKKSRKSTRDVFNRLPASKINEARSIQNLRALAHLTSPSRHFQGKKTQMSSVDMQNSLQRRARQQAVEERKAKIEDLKARGIIVQTAEERQQDQAEVEDLLEKARREGEEIMQKEKRAAKKAKIANGEVDALPDTSDEDEDYNDQEDDAEVELSGSDEEEEGDEEGESDGIVSDPEGPLNEDDAEGGVSLEPKGSQSIGLVDDEASEDGDDEQDDDIETAVESDEDDLSEKQIQQRTRRKRLVIDDDDEDQDLEDKSNVERSSPAVAVPDIPMGPSDFGIIPMRMTQAFAATMADTQTQECENGDGQDSMALLDSVPEPHFPIFDANDSLQMVEDSQNDLRQAETNASNQIDLHFSQSQIRYDALGDSQGQVVATQMSEMPDPTQDVGFVLSSPAPERIISEPPSTVDTVLLPHVAGDDSPVKKKRGRLQRRAIVEDRSDNDEDQSASLPMGSGLDIVSNAFDEMKRARKVAKVAAAKEAFDRKRSEAKEIVEEQAQESEDEYAGLGGASDEDSEEEDEDVNAMMDHGEVKVDERRLAQLFA